MNAKHWNILQPDKEKAREIAEQYGLPPVAALLLAARGITGRDEIREYLSPGAQMMDPFLLKGMEPAVKRIRQALEEGERMAVYGDYDADGVTAAAILYSYFLDQGADVLYELPSRHKEGYGLHKSSVDYFAKQGVSLIITVDNGITAVEEANYVRELGMDLIVTDHHMPGPEIPCAVAVIDAHQKDCPSTFKDYCGAGVAYQLVRALEQGNEQLVEDNFSDLAALGTIADVMPLLSDNRILVRAGLKAIAGGERPGLLRLMEAGGIKPEAMDSGGAAFGIAPRINAAGRMGAPHRCVQLLLSEEEEEAGSLAEEINSENQLRQQVEKEILEQAGKQLAGHPNWQYGRVLVLAGEGWHCGVIGIVASRLCERYAKPAIVLSLDGEQATGSGRSLPGFPLYEALCACGEYLTHFGGHPQAAGMSLPVSRIEAFRDAINRYAALHFRRMPVQEITVDFRINPAMLTLDTVEQMKLLEPFGQGNPKPVLGLFRMEITGMQILKEKHIKLSLRKGEAAAQVMLFNRNPGSFPFIPGDLVDIAVSAEQNKYQGRTYLSLVGREIRFSDVEEDAILQADFLSGQVMRGEALEAPEFELVRMGRGEVAQVYKFLRGCPGCPDDAVSLWRRMNQKDVNIAKVRLSLEILKEMGLISCGENAGLTLNPTQQKVDLEQSRILRHLRADR